ncbi:hypothetical protein DRE_03926 [Drechslerella stenobrocha 248]|uniref:Uncharacterized protein n=1 Tax=Drechslerella stenobrocha 248 TaxID=1043628 RepID=W7HTY1_9PEZI|nr:hypothetical protein DRE_03926 [Drechslerella stenobrocha 248]
MPSTTLLLLLSIVQFTALSYALPHPSPTMAGTVTATATPTAAAATESSRKLSSLSAGIICGVVAISIFAVGAIFYAYRKYHQRKSRRRTQIRMDQMQASLNARLQNARRSGLLEGSVLKVYEGDGGGVRMQVTEITAGSPVEQQLASTQEKQPFKAAVVRDRPVR